ncbi:MAG: hypothetical protein KIT16_20990 [Rhodospirillaceae bacterium]|nr:hypothetical protein [Rhodospirillaceae bacterium]
MDAGYCYIVRYWIAPAAEARVLAYLDGGHTAEMAALPGFLWARRLRFQDVDAMGWRGFATIYGLRSKAALDAYFADPIRDRFAGEQAAFAGVMRVERSWGPVEWAAGNGRPDA